MQASLTERLRALEQMSGAELRHLWRETFGQSPRSSNVPWMRRRLAWGLQAQVLGGLSEAAKKHIEELIPFALAWGFRSFPQQNRAVSPVERGRLVPGTVLSRRYKDRTIIVTVRENGFEHDGAIHKSLSAVAKAVTGSHWNGNLFFGLGARRRTSA